MIKSIIIIIFIPGFSQAWPLGALSSWFQCFLTVYISPQLFPVQLFFLSTSFLPEQRILGSSLTLP